MPRLASQIPIKDFMEIFNTKTINKDLLDVDKIGSDLSKEKIKKDSFVSYTNGLLTKFQTLNNLSFFGVYALTEDQETVHITIYLDKNGKKLRAISSPSPPLDLFNIDSEHIILRQIERKIKVVEIKKPPTLGEKVMVSVQATANVIFSSYGHQPLDDIAKNQIGNHLKLILKEHAQRLPLLVIAENDIFRKDVAELVEFDVKFIRLPT